MGVSGFERFDNGRVFKRKARVYAVLKAQGKEFVLGHGVLSEVVEIVGFEECDLLGRGTAKCHHVLADIRLQFGAVGISWVGLKG